MRYLLSVLIAALLQTTVFAVPAKQGDVSKRPNGFVTTKGTNFELDGKPFVRTGAPLILKYSFVFCGRLLLARTPMSVCFTKRRDTTDSSIYSGCRF